jgi:hypothetical protein
LRRELEREELVGLEVEELLLRRLHRVHPGGGLDWIIRHPESIHFGPEQRIAKQGHFPNLVAFTNLLRGLQNFSKLWKRKIACITHDEQSEFGRMLQTWHALFSNAAPDIIEWAGESYSLQMAPGSHFVIKRDEESAGIQMADVALWLYSQALKGKEIPPGCASILNLVLERGWHDDFSFAGVHDQIIEKWGEAAVRLAKLPGKVSPHTLRHTAATWLMQAGVDKWEAAGFLGMTVEMLDRVYGHHHPDHLKVAARAIGYRPRQSLGITLGVERARRRPASQSLEKIGGPGRTRTCNQAVMSEPRSPEDQAKSDDSDVT